MRLKFRPRQAERALSRCRQEICSLKQRPPRSLLVLASGSGAVLASRDSLEGRMPFGAASQIPECAPDLRIGSHCESGLRRCERWLLTSSTHKPGATGLALSMTRSSDNPEFRPERIRIRYESNQFGWPASSLPRRLQLQTQAFVRDFGSRYVS
jgi:hypothetical protein